MRHLHLLFCLTIVAGILSCRREKEAEPRAEVIHPATEKALPPPLPPATALVLKMASVDMQELLKNCREAREIREELNAGSVHIKKENEARIARIQGLDTELQAAAKQISDPAVAESAKQKIAEERAIKFQEAIALDRERREYMDRQGALLREKFVARMQKLIGEVQSVVAEAGRREDFDYIFDRSGLATSQVPFVLYSTKTADLTAEVLAQLNRTAGKVEAPGYQEHD